MARSTPPMNVKGAFLLRAPFTTNPDMEYTVVAHRSYNEVRVQKNDPFTLVYKPVGLTKADMELDIAEGAIIIALATRTGTIMYVPDTYIDSYPFMGAIPYSHLVASCSLGMLPDDFDTTTLVQAIGSAVSDHIGVEPQVFIARAETSDFIDEDRHAQLTISRNQAIVDRETDHARSLRLAEELAVANERIAEQNLLIQELSPPPAAE